MEQSLAHHTQPLVDRLLDLERPTDVRLSPTGRHVLYSAAPLFRTGKHAKSTIWVAEYGKQNSARAITSGLYNDRMPRWSPDEKSILFLSDRANVGESCALYSLPFTMAGEASAMTDVKAKKEITSYDISPDGKYVLYVSSDEQSDHDRKREEIGKDAFVWGEKPEYGRLRILRRQDGTVATIFDEPRHVKDQVVWTADSSAVVFVTADMPEDNCVGIRFEAYSIATQERRIVASWQALIWQRPFVFLQDKVYFLAGRHPTRVSSSLAVWQLDLRSGALDPITKNENDCANNLTVTTNALVIHYIYKESLRLVLLKPTSHSEVLLESQAAISSIDAVNLANSSGRPLIVAVMSRSDMPHEVICTDADARPGHPPGLLNLSRHGGKTPEFAKRCPVEIQATSRQGNLQLSGLLFRAASGDVPETTARQTIVAIHGGPYSRVLNSFNPGMFYWHEVFFKLGFNVLCPNYRGSSGQGEKFAAEAVGAVGTGEYDDVLCLVQKGVQKGLIDKDRLVFGGWSQGGFLSYLGAVRNGRFTDGTPCGFRIRGAICGAGVTDWDMLTMTSDIPRFEGELAGGAPWASSKDNLHTRRGSAIWEFSNATDIPPILILHGKEDARVPHSQAVAFHRACRSKSIPCEFVTYPREGHDLQERAHVADMLKRIARFSEKHLKDAVGDNAVNR